MDKKAFTLSELMIASILILIIMFSAATVLVLTSRFYLLSSRQAALQQEADIIIARLVRGEPAAAGAPVIGLSEAAPTQLTPPLDMARIDFLTIDDLIHPKRYYWVKAANNIQYIDSVGNNTIIYAPPLGSGIVIDELDFWPPPNDDGLGNTRIGPGILIPLQSVTTGITVKLKQNVGGTDIYASASTLVTFRNSL